MPSISGIDESTKEGSIQQTQVQNAEPTPAPLIQEPVIKAPLSVPRLLIPDTSAPIPGQGGNGNGLSPGSLSPGRPANLRRHSNVSLRSSGGYSSSSKNSVDGTWLNAQLRRARIEYHRHAHSYIIPTCKQKELITAANIEQDIRDKDDSIEEAEIKHVAQKACAIAPKVFATLALMKKGPEICSLLRDGISDEDLPLKRREKGKGDFTLERDSGVPIETFEHWNEDEKEDFDRVQWWMIAPVFKHKEHHELDERAILPFIPFETNTETEKKKEGGYSEVFARRIHPSHHNFWGPSKLLVRKHYSHLMLS